MSGPFRVEQREFQETLKKLAAQTSRDLPLFLNSRMLAIAKTSRDKTPKASREQIESDLNVVGYSLNYTKKGDRLKKRARGGAIFGGKRIYALVNARQKKLGKPGIPRNEMEAAAQALAVRRFRAVGSLRSGWARAIGTLAAAVKVAIEKTGGPRVKQASVAKPAKDGFSPTVTMEYRETVQHNGSTSIDLRVVAALQQGFDAEKVEMMRHLEEQMEKTAKKAGAK